MNVLLVCGVRGTSYRTYSDHYIASDPESENWYIHCTYIHVRGGLGMLRRIVSQIHPRPQRLTEGETLVPLGRHCPNSEELWTTRKRQ